MMTQHWFKRASENPKIPPGHYLARIRQFESQVSTQPQTHGVRAYGVELALAPVDLEQLRQGPVEGGETQTQITVCLYLAASEAAGHLRATFERFFFIQKDQDNRGRTGLVYVGASRKISPVDEEHGILVYLPSLRQMNGLAEPPVRSSQEENLVLPMGQIQQHVRWLLRIVQEETARITHLSLGPKDLRYSADKIETATKAVSHYIHTGQWLGASSLEEGEEEPE
jgi:hypothetical protein